MSEIELYQKLQRAQSEDDKLKILSKAIIEFSLWSRSSGFLLELKDNGKHILKEF